METAKNIVEKFGSNCPIEIQQVAIENPLKQYELIHFIEPNKFYKSKRLNSKFSKFISVVILSGKNEFLSIKGFSKFLIILLAFVIMYSE